MSNMTDEANKQAILKEAKRIQKIVSEEIKYIKDAGKLPPELNKALNSIETLTKSLVQEILDKIYRQTRLTDFTNNDSNGGN
mgnify:FL=1